MARPSAMIGNTVGGVVPVTAFKGVAGAEPGPSVPVLDVGQGHLLAWHDSCNCRGF